ncbi:putative DNA repair protein XRCC3 like protein [Blattamonas nauphoetae]|uniref:DNA repair protein XRCC3 like protein n=1 Tax=Blattamonas nauphoetae TaxID=2049346 RepID=A0ABQ9XQM1_9EUKA|nr:putative DNA repair protein XRCC3 like protein [Blattamonas nauphoetae]
MSTKEITAPLPQTAFSFLNKLPRLKTGCPSIDTILSGGLPVCGINEICGESAVGKTQLCFQLCCNAQLPLECGGLNGYACYISTEGPPHTGRLQEIASYVANSQPFEVEWNLCDNILLSTAGTSAELLQIIREKLPVLLQIKEVKLIIIDSLTSLIRHEFDQASTIARTNLLSETLSEQHQICVVCVNQVTSIFDEPPDETKFLVRSLVEHYKDTQGQAFGHVYPTIEEFSRTKPSLGMAWAHLVTTRLFLTRTSHNVKIKIRTEIVEEEEGQITDIKKRKRTESTKTTVVEANSSVRRLSIVFSPHLRIASASFIVTTNGIEDYMP